jgi:hypothetical protein
MKKKIYTTLLMIGSFASMNSQTIVHNEKLFSQITKNQAVRLASNESILNSYEKQKKIYDEVNKKLIQIVAIQDFIYSNLVNIKMGIKQGKSIKYLLEIFREIGKNGKDMIELTVKHPEYAVLFNQYHINAGTQLMEMEAEFRNEIMREDQDFLMDPYQRQQILRNLYTRASLINGNLIYIKLLMKDRKKVPYIYQIPAIGNYINLDKGIVLHIMQQYNGIF